MPVHRGEGEVGAVAESSLVDFVKGCNVVDVVEGRAALTVVASHQDVNGIRVLIKQSKTIKKQRVVSKFVAVNDKRTILNKTETMIYRAKAICVYHV